MGMIEDQVLEIWLGKNAGHFEGFGFNVPVWMDPPEKRPFLSRSKTRSVRPEPYRIDVVGRFGDECELIEVKETGNMTAIGQLLTYSMLFRKSYWGYKVLHMRLVCVRAPDPVKASCLIQGINIDEAGVEASRLISQFRKRNISTL